MHLSCQANNKLAVLSFLSHLGCICDDWIGTFFFLKHQNGLCSSTSAIAAVTLNHMLIYILLSEQEIFVNFKLAVES